MQDDRELELAKTADDLNNLISSTEIATLFLDKNLNVRRFTTHALELFNLMPADVGKPLAQIPPYLDNKDYFQDIETVLDTLVPVEKDVAITAENKWYAMRIIPYKTVDNAIDGVVMTFVDITTRKEIELELQDSERKYHDAFNNAEFLKSLLMHDINNVLTVISMTITTLDKDIMPPTAENVKSAHTRIQEQVLRGANLVRNVKRIAEIQECEARAEPVKICNVIRETVAFIQRSSSAGKMEFELNANGKESIAVLGSEHLSHAFENIILNGLKYNTSEVKSIRIDVAEELIADNQMVKVSVSDNGFGIPEEMKNIISTGTFKRDQDGTRGLGIGLSLVTQIINRVGGKLIIEDRVPGDRSKGTTVHVLLKKSS